MTRLKPDDRKYNIEEAAIKVAERVGYNKMTRAEIANEVGCADTLINKYMGTMPNLRRTVMRKAVRDKNLIVIGQGLVVRDTHALKATPELQRLAMEFFLSCPTNS